jgi:hypothetical protein
MYYVSCKKYITWLRYLLLNEIFQLSSKTTHFRAQLYRSFFLCFDAKNSLLMFDQAF